MTEKQKNESLGAALAKRSFECERGILAVGGDEYGFTCFGFALVGPNSILFTYQPCPGLLVDNNLN